MNIKEDRDKKRKVLDDVIRISTKLIKEIKEEKTIKDINELMFCLSLLQRIATEQKEKLKKRIISKSYIT